VDRHLQDKNKAAFIFVGEPEGEALQVLTSRELYVRGMKPRRCCATLRIGRLEIGCGRSTLPIFQAADYHAGCARMGAVVIVVVVRGVQAARPLRIAILRRRIPAAGFDSMPMVTGATEGKMDRPSRKIAGVAIENSEKKKGRKSISAGVAAVRVQNSSTRDVMGRDFFVAEV